MIPRTVLSSSLITSIEPVIGVWHQEQVRGVSEGGIYYGQCFQATSFLRKTFHKRHLVPATPGAFPALHLAAAVRNFRLRFLRGGSDVPESASRQVPPDMGKLSADTRIVKAAKIWRQDPVRRPGPRLRLGHRFPQTLLPGWLPA